MSCEQLLTEFLNLSKRLANLDFALAEHLEELERIQQRQAEIRTQFDQLTAKGRIQISPEMGATAAEIKEIEFLNMNRMLKFKAELEQTKRNIESAKRVRNVYENSFFQEFGYFVDSHK